MMKRGDGGRGHPMSTTAEPRDIPFVPESHEALP